MMMKVENPTVKTKAVRVAGGFEVIKPGKSATVESVWSEIVVARYKAAGLIMSEAKPARAKSDKE